MKQIDGIWWPDSDEKSHVAAYNKMLRELDHILNFVEQKRVCIQAGGAVGIWPQYLSQYFDYVYTFEANPNQFKCLQQNVTATNVFKYNCAIGEAKGHIGFIHDNERCNASHVTRDSHDVYCTDLDSLGFADMPVDFICLDLEGFEIFALRGAKHILEKQSPVIQVENKHYPRYSVDKSAVKNYMKSLGYDMIYSHKYDQVYKKEA